MTPQTGRGLVVGTYVGQQPTAVSPSSIANCMLHPGTDPYVAEQAVLCPAGHEIPGE